MSRDISDPSRPCTLSFQRIVDTFLGGEGLPFAKVLSAERIERVFRKHVNLFGADGIYHTALTLWAFLSQVLRDGKEASCQSAVARVVAHCQQMHLPAPSNDTGAYCRARAKLSAAALQEISGEVAAEIEQSIDESLLWKGKHAKLIDGFTFTMPDTEKNQAMYPQMKTQTPGVGFPIARCVAILSLATCCVMDAAIGPYFGKETGESALLRSMLERLSPADIAVMDRHYCSFMLLALLHTRGVHSCSRRHQARKFDFRRGKRLGKYDHIIVWTRPSQPEWMSDDMYAQIPKTLELRELRYNIVVPGRRTQTVDVITTLTDHEEYTKDDIAQLYGFRWNSELDIRSIKDGLNLAHVRCQSPQMVHSEFWAIILAYNLIRITAANAAILHGKQPRQISFTGTCQYVLASWTLTSLGLVDDRKCHDFRIIMHAQIAACEVGNRPGRLEPRVLKRRTMQYPLMRKPRKVLKAELRKQCT